MKRLSDSKALISLISVIFILLAGMAMTGCGATLTQAAKEGNIAAIQKLLDQGAISREDMETRIIKSDVDELPAIKAKLNKNAYAIVIGIEQYRQKLPKADYAVADAKIMAEYLTKVMGYPEENVVTLTNDRVLDGFYKIL